MLRASPWPASVAVVAGVLLAVGARAHAAGSVGLGTEARRLSGEATAAFGAGRYGEAGERFAAAFALHPDPVLLFNAAQSYRLAGEKPRALELYGNYVQMYPAGANAADARAQAAALKKAIDAEPPVPAGSPPPPPVPAPPPPPATTPTIDRGVPLVSRPAAADDKKAGGSKTWIWGAIGAAVVVGVVTAIALASSGGEDYPAPTFGTARGN